VHINAVSASAAAAVQLTWRLANDASAPPFMQREARQAFTEGVALTVAPFGVLGRAKSLGRGTAVPDKSVPLAYDISKWGEYGLPSDGYFSRTLTAEQYRAFRSGREFNFGGKPWPEGGYPDGMGFIGSAEEARGLTTVAGYREALKLDYNPKYVLEFQLRDTASLQNAIRAPYAEFVPGGRTGAGFNEWNFPGISSNDIINPNVRVLE